MRASDNNILLTDSYKVTHWKQYPPDTTHVYSYFESRGSDKYMSTCFFGLQYFLKEYLQGIVITDAKLKEAKHLLQQHFGKDLVNEEGWRYIIDKHNGRLPVIIRAVPEGTVVPNRNVLMTVENTDPKCFWLTNYIETLLSQVWYPCTVATQSRFMKKMIHGYLEQSGTPEDIAFKLHDFGFRGSTSVESAGLGGCAHLVNFLGTDTLAALVVARDYYNCECAGFSIPAAEHSTITSWDKEVDSFENMLTQFPDGLVAVVSDSYNIFDACNTLWGKVLKDKIMNRNGCLVIRPDSGDPCIVLPTILDILGGRFGSTRNKKGFKVLNPHIRIIQGDGIDVESIPKILDAIQRGGWSADNLAFGSGGGLLQKVNRDTLKYAFKCSHTTRKGGISKDVFKNPITDMVKASKKGRITLFKDCYGEYYTELFGGTQEEDCLETVFLNGEVVKDYSMAEIRKRAEI